MPQPNPTAQASGDEQSAQRLAQLTRRWSSLRDIGLQNRGNVERIESEIEAASRDAEERFGTSDLDALRAIVVRAREEDAAALDAFEASIAQAEARLREIRAP